MRDDSPLRLLLRTVAGRVLREQTATIAYLVEENRVLEEQSRERPDGHRPGRETARSLVLPFAEQNL